VRAAAREAAAREAAARAENSRDNAAIFDCVTCGNGLRIRLAAALPAGTHRCPRCQQEYRLLVAGKGAPVFLVVPKPAQRAPEERAAPQKRQVPPEVRAALVVLGVGESASVAELRKAYMALVASYHPDKVATLGPELRQVAEEKTKQINAAYAVAKEFLEDAA
jgi:DnaJ-domain-containing protein 1